MDWWWEGHLWCDGVWVLTEGASLSWRTFEGSVFQSEETAIAKTLKWDFMSNSEGASVARVEWARGEPKDTFREVAGGQITWRFCRTWWRFQILLWVRCEGTWGLKQRSDVIWLSFKSLWLLREEYTIAEHRKMHGDQLGGYCQSIGQDM